MTSFLLAKPSAGIILDLLDTSIDSNSPANRQVRPSACFVEDGEKEKVSEQPRFEGGQQCSGQRPAVSFARPVANANKLQAVEAARIVIGEQLVKDEAAGAVDVGADNLSQ